MITNFTTGITYILGLVVILIYILLTGAYGYQMLYQNEEKNELVTFKKFLFGFFAFHFVMALIIWLISGIGWVINLFI